MDAVRLLWHVLISPTVVEHNRADLEAAVEHLRQAQQHMPCST